ncbi:MAG: hypothetical protein ACFE8P_13275 [Promethearchaeota archaeon]
MNEYIFYFVKKEDYFKSKAFQNTLRKESINKKIIIISLEKNLVHQLFSFFPDTYIHDVRLEREKESGENILRIFFLSYEERGIAIGRSGDYIKTVNELFDEHLKFEKLFTFEQYTIPIKIRCELLPFTKELL